MISNAICANESPMIRYLIICPSTFQDRAKEKKKPSQFLGGYSVPTNTISCSKIPEFEDYYALYLKDDPAKEPILVGDSAPAALADAARKIGRPKHDLELRRISRNEYETLKRFFD
jgi:hypothetical protein